MKIGNSIFFEFSLYSQSKCLGTNRTDNEPNRNESTRKESNRGNDVNSVLCSTAACTVAHMRVCPRQCVYVCVCTRTLWTSSKLAGLHGVKIASDPQSATKGTQLK